MRVTAAGSVAVPTRQPGLRPTFLQALLNLLRSQAELFDTVGTTIRADVGVRLAMSTMMADQGRCRPVEGERNVTARAGHYMAAIAAEHVRSRATPVEEDNRLLLPGQGLC